MRRLVAIGGAALVLAGLGNAATGPSLRLASTNPFVVKGAHFRAPENVVVTLTVNRQQSTRRVRTTTGSFTVNFGTVKLGRCSGFTVRAIGSRGDGATFKRPPLPACLPELSP
jgi:hypothetical protein